MSEWKEYRLGDIVTILGGFAYKGEHIGHGEGLLLGMGCVSFKEKFLMSGARPYAGDCAERYYANPGDLVLATRQQSDNLPILGMPAIIPQELDGKKLIVGANLYRVSNNSDFSNKYLYWLLKSNAYVNHIASCKTGTTVSMITKSNVEDFVFKAPEKQERARIVSVLSSLDDKIDLLHRENATLETIAETLFRHYFIENPNPDWKEGKLGDEFDFTMGQSPSGDSFNEDGVGIPMYQGNADFGFRFPTKRVFTTAPTRFAEENDTLISVRAPVGAQNMASERCCIGRGVAAFKYKWEPFYSYTYYKLKSLLEDIRQFNDNGTVFGSISKSDFENIDIVIPSKVTIVAFQEQVEPIDDKIKINQQQIISLSSQRDTLLPRLMSGEVIVGE